MQLTKQLCTLIITVLIGLAPYWSFASEIKPVATCTFSGLKFEIFHPFKDSFVRVKKGFSSVDVQADFMHTWIDYTAKFEFEGEQLTLVFPTYISPSIGFLTHENGEEKDIACMLNNLHTK